MESEDELLYQIGEAIMTEVENIQDVFYSKFQKERIVIFLKNGKKIPPVYIQRTVSFCACTYVLSV